MPNLARVCLHISNRSQDEYDTVVTACALLQSVNSGLQVRVLVSEQRGQEHQLFPVDERPDEPERAQGDRDGDSKADHESDPEGDHPKREWKAGKRRPKGVGSKKQA